MELIIESSMSLRDIRGVFNTTYPYLKLEFFDFKAGSEVKFSRENIVTKLNITLSQLGNDQAQSFIRVNRSNKTGDLEKIFREKFGVHVQVFRKTGAAWIETTQTDDWTLDEQNKAGMESAAGRTEDISPDYDLYHEQL